MDFSKPLNVAFAILGISLLVVAHEAGHYLAARAFGMRVLRFSIGLGKPIWKYQPKGSPTVFQICAIPLLAYVQIDGMNPTEPIDPDDPELYPNKGPIARSLTIFAGPFANYLIASLLLLLGSQIGGLPEADYTNVVGRVFTPAAQAKVRRGDVIVEVNGRPVTDRESLVEANADRAGLPTEYVLERDGERVPVTITPERRENIVAMGVILETRIVYNTRPLADGARYALLFPVRATELQLEGIARVFRRRETRDLQSVVGITGMLAESMEEAPQQFLFLLIQISIALGLFNLLPFPALDGGRLTFLAYELITRRRANERVEATIHTVGLLFLLGVLAIFMARDVMKLT